MAEPHPPLILFMDNAAGEEVALRIEADDDFQTFLDKAKSLLGFDVDINSITKNQPVSPSDNVYQFLINLDQNLATEAELTAQNFQQILEPTGDEDDLVYILDDGTQIRASQIHFDNEDPLVDLTVEKIPFVKYANNVTDDIDSDKVEVQDTKLYNIVESPISRWSSKNTSPQCNFVNTLPFKLICNNTSGFEAQFTKYLEASANKSYATLSNVVNRIKSPRSLIRENYKNYEDNFPAHRNTDDFAHYTREEILNMFKDSPVTSLPYENQGFTEKRRHVRKSDPSRSYKSWNTKPISNIDMDGVLIAESENQNCFICNRFVDSNIEKLYLFDNEDQRLHRSSPQKKLSTQLKIICEQCLDENFKPSRLKSPNQSLNPDEYLVIRNNQQYIFQKANSLNFKKHFSNFRDAKAIIDKIESEFLKDKKKTEFVKVEIGSDGEIVTKPIDNDAGSDDIIIVKDERKESSSDVEIIENGPEIDDNIIDNLDDADEEVKEFLGKYQCDDVELKELKCRFCERIFADMPEVIEHGETHKHVLEDGEVFPCPLCDYGYANYKWLKGHLKAAHDRKTEPVKCEDNDPLKEDITKVAESPSPQASPIAKRTRSAAKKVHNASPKGSPERTTVSTDLTTNSESVKNDFEIKTEVKHETMESSDDEIWIVQTADDEAEQQLKKIFDAAKKEEADGVNKHSCRNCGQLYVSTEGLANHKCRRRAPKGKSIKDGAIRTPSYDDFVKRARGRPRLHGSGDELLTVRPRKKKTKETTSNPQIVTCHNCEESFTSKVRLKFHMQFHDTNNSMLTPDGQYYCVECPSATFPTETELFDHLHFQHKQKRWQCPVKDCGKTFYLRATLTKHSRMHTDTRRYACSTCGKRFLDKQTLDEHGVTHLQIKPFQCHICLKQLTRRSRLRMHLRAHEEELCPRLVLVCAVCSRAFRDADDVQEHLIRSPECIAEFTNELKEENDAVAVQLSPTSGLVSHTVKVVESPKLCMPVRRQASGPPAEALLARVSGEARALVRVVEIDRAFRCEYCEEVFYSESGLNNHRIRHKGVKNPFTCHICKVSFATYSRCTTHKTTHGFYKRSLAHVKKQGEESPTTKQEGGPSSTGILGYGDFPVVKHFLCENCGRSYLHWTYLQVHRRMKHAVGNYKYQCSQCDLKFPNSWSVSYHKKKIHSKEDSGSTSKPPKDDYRIPCRDCDEVLPNKTALYKHRKKEHSDVSLRVNNKPGASGVFWCGTCDKQYGSRAGLEAHSRGHAARVTACAKCGHSFPHVAALHAHLKEAHGHELDHPCEACPKRFCSRAELAVHRRSHSALRPHACPQCGRAFRTASVRNEHLRIHTGERPFPCDVCGIAFRRSTAMRNHRLIHTGVRAWACGRCPKRFRIRSDLRTHLRLKHPAHLAVIELSGLSPTPEQVMEQLSINSITHDKVIEITKISFPKGTRSVVPSSSQALALLAHVPRTQVACSRTRPPLSPLPPRPPHYELFQPARRGRGIARNPRKARTDSGSYPMDLSLNGERDLDESGTQQSIGYSVTLDIPEDQPPEIPQTDAIAYPIALNVSGEELSELNVQMLLREGVLVNGNQMVQLQMDRPMMME